MQARVVPAFYLIGDFCDTTSHTHSLLNANFLPVALLQIVRFGSAAGVSEWGSGEFN